MARNKDKFEYIEVSIPKESDLYQLLSADANRAAQSLAQIILVRLADYYSGSQPGAHPQVARPVKPQIEAAPSVQEDRKQREASFVFEEEYQQKDDEPVFDFSKAMASADLFDQFN